MPNRIWDRLRPWVLLFAFLLVGIIFLFATNEPAVRTIRAASLETSSWVEARFAWAGSFLSALDENDRLRQENIRLAGMLAQSRQARLENDELRSMIQLRDTSSYPLLPARVISKDITLQRNLLTINVGATDSVETGMAVVDARGVVGKVVLTSAHYSRVMPYLNTSFRVPGSILPLEANGIVSWNGGSRHQLVMEHVAKTMPVLQGQLVVTSASSSVFPSGYPIGFVDSVSAEVGRNEQLVYLTPMSPLGAVEYAFVIMTDFSEEVQALEDEELFATIQ